jgi:transposase
MMMSSTQFVGIDVAKATLDISLRPSQQTWQINYEASAVAELVEQLRAQLPTLIVVEATGGLEAP